MHTLITSIKYAAQLPVPHPLIALSWLSVCLLVLGTGLIVLLIRLVQSFLAAFLQIMRA